jgi:beta-N-acetylhexosaminidase
VTLFREWNMTSPDQVAELTSSLQELNSSALPLLIAVDQEGGQLIGLPGSTPFAGNMAIGATGDPDLAREVANRMGRELSVVGVNVNYAPVADVATRADNPSLGVRSFGDDPEQVAGHTASMVAGFRSAGILATAKHFPGKGEATVDPHYQLPLLDLDRERLDSVELPPFRAAFEAGVELLMMGHYVVPSVTGSDEVPISASPRGIDGFVRAELGFDGVVITDALDMGALDQGPAQVVEIISMMRGGTDLLLCMPDPALQERVRVALERGVSRDLISEETLARSRNRVERARRAVTSGRQRLAQVAGAEHQSLAAQLAQRSVTLVRNERGRLPLRLAQNERVLSLEPQPTNVTPADTTALYPPLLASSLRHHHADVTEIVYPHDPEQRDISAIIAVASEHDLVVMGTVTATDGQAQLANALIGSGVPLVAVALRTPHDLLRYPEVDTYLCTYSGLEPSMTALATRLFRGADRPGSLPVAIGGLYPRGHGLTR